MDIIALGLAQQAIDSSVSGWSNVTLDEQTGEVTATNNNGQTFKWSYPIPSDGEDGQDGRDGYGIFIAYGRTGGDDHGYFRDSDLQEPLIGEIHLGDFILFTLNSCLYRITEITEERGIKHYRYSIPGLSLRGQDGHSPSIVVKSSTSTEYILTITDATHTFDTPNLRPNDTVSKDYVDDLVSETIRRLEALINQKQNKLVAGNNISISGNVISATGVSTNPSQTPTPTPSQTSEPTFKLFSAPKNEGSDDVIVQETHDTENNVIDRDENLYVQFNEGESEPELSIVDDNLQLTTEQDITMYIDEDSGDLMLETED